MPETVQTVIPAAAPAKPLTLADHAKIVADAWKATQETAKKRGELHKAFVAELKDQGVPHDSADGLAAEWVSRNFNG